MPDDLPPYTVRESAKARRILLKALPGAGLTVVLPKGVDPSFARLAVQQQAEWARAALKELYARGQLSAHPTLPHQVLLAAVGESYKVCCIPDDPRRLTLREKEGALVFRGDVANVQACLEKLRAWLLEAGRRRLVPWCLALSQDLGLPVAKVRVGRQRTRWGSCSSRGAISLNCSLLFLPPEAARYVIIHELCHLLHNNHSPAYWREVARRVPNFDALDASLRESWRHVPLWALG